MSARLITDDVMVVDSGSTDATIGIAQHYGCRVFTTAWKGYGAAKTLVTSKRDTIDFKHGCR